MATNAQDIVDAIDAHVLSAAGGPGELGLPNGEVIKYRSLEELTSTRKYYAGLVEGAKVPSQRIHISKFVGGSAR